MFGMEILDVAVGLTLVYLLLASVCSVIRERIEATMKMRGVDLERGIREMLDGHNGSAWTAKLYNHPLIYGLFQGRYTPEQINPLTGQMPARSNLPSYIPARNFAMALLDIVAHEPVAGAEAATPAHIFTRALSLDSLRRSAAQIENTAVQRAVLCAVDTAAGDLCKAQAQVEAWFNSSMDRVSGWYRRRTQQIIVVLSVIVTVAVNANTLTLIERLSVDASLRQALIQRAGHVTESASGGGASAIDSAKSDTTAPAAKASVQDAAMETLGALGLPLGWSEGWPGPRGNPLMAVPSKGDFPSHWGWWWFYLFHPLIGLLLTVTAVSLGAPFWFDMLNRIISLRSSLKPPEPEAEEKKKKAPPAAVVQLQLPPAQNPPG
jgi:hypothetical protein